MDRTRQTCLWWLKTYIAKNVLFIKTNLWQTFTSWNNSILRFFFLQDTFWCKLSLEWCSKFNLGVFGTYLVLIKTLCDAVATGLMGKFAAELTVSPFSLNCFLYPSWYFVLLALAAKLALMLNSSWSCGTSGSASPSLPNMVTSGSKKTKWRQPKSKLEASKVHQHIWTEKRYQTKVAQ